MGIALSFGQFSCSKCTTRADLSPGETRIASGERAVPADRFAEKSFGNRVVWGRTFLQMPQATLINTPRIKALRGLAYRPTSFRVGDGRRDRFGYCIRDLVLNGKDVAKLSVVPLGPAVVIGFGIDQLTSHPYSTSRVA